MSPDEISVVIPTRNRFALLERAIGSALAAGVSEDRIVVVDDESTDGTPERARGRFPRAKVLEQVGRQGPGAARNRGIAAVETRYALMLDDDDMATHDALRVIAWALSRCGEPEKWPVFQFATGQARMGGDYRILTLKDYVSEAVLGDFSALIHIPVFRRGGFEYPASAIGGESLLWFCIARDAGIPTWMSPVITVNHDAGARLCSVESQLRRPREYAASIEALIDAFGQDMRRLSPAYYRKKRVGAAVYRLIAGERGAALRHALSLGQSGDAMSCAALMASAALPGTLVRRLFGLWRQRAFA